MREGRVATTPIGFRQFCRIERSYCARYRNARKGGPALVALTPERLVELDGINRTVNREVFQMPEVSLFFSSHKDEWKIPTNSGDCEDLALLKQARLIEMGWPESALLLTIADTPEGTRHAVLTVRTWQGDMILDSLTDRIHDWRNVEYRWIKRQSSRNMMRWVVIAARA